METAVKWHTSPLSNFPNACSLLLSSLDTGSSAGIFPGEGLGHCSCNVLVSDLWLGLVLKCSGITYLHFGAKIMFRSHLIFLLHPNLISVVLLFLWKANLFLPFFFSFLKWGLFGDCGGCNISFELDLLTLGLLILRYCQADMDEWSGTAGVNVFWDLSLLWLLHSNILLSYRFFLCSSLKEWERYLEYRWKGPLPQSFL